MGKNCIPTRSMDAMHLLSVTRLVDWNQLHVICILYSFSNVQTCPKEHGPSEIWVEQERLFITMVPLVLKIKHDRHKSQFFFSCICRREEWKRAMFWYASHIENIFSYIQHLSIQCMNMLN